MPACHAGPQRHAQFRIHFPVRLLSQALGQQLGDAWNACRAADQQNAIELVRTYRRVIECGRDGAHGAGQQFLDGALEIGAAPFP